MAKRFLKKEVNFCHTWTINWDRAQ